LKCIYKGEICRRQFDACSTNGSISTFILKLEITRPFLLVVMKKMGFCMVWCDNINGLLLSSSTLVLLNGVPGDIVHPHNRHSQSGLLCFATPDFSYVDEIILFLGPSANDIGLTFIFWTSLEMYWG